ncbi:hypothetical protein Droror1_Dr00025292, partial [Drosera rotundifolia]
SPQRFDIENRQHRPQHISHQTPALSLVADLLAQLSIPDIKSRTRQLLTSIITPRRRPLYQHLKVFSSPLRLISVGLLPSSLSPSELTYSIDENPTPLVSEILARNCGIDFVSNPSTYEFNVLIADFLLTASFARFTLSFWEIDGSGQGLNSGKSSRVFWFGVERIQGEGISGRGRGVRENFWQILTQHFSQEVFRVFIWTLVGGLGLGEFMGLKPIGLQEKGKALGRFEFSFGPGLIQ